ncbi:hypothetical protein RO3G_16700 [Rhizopus delemar RA 99-880]|uniref:Uncharacterized protein n=1 Tax=Rhizopus delemar (strain RA 99-880 / ATCC MYA-4621 / FGSC 9543 / NRRL 43880) TaxID=246409 RepID=I1CU59_RHIO9|nr:hypothetical protein RO3G_16700 [Rhizopus delemar RA 99-880]|eukprot:EIE91989.1 hypothetical protein RO3G_16700 [Rhizopus delemar RA 99-880]
MESSKNYFKVATRFSPTVRITENESAFNINMHPSGGWAEKGKPAIVTTPSTRAVYHTILGAISSKFAVSMELRNPKEEWSKHIKIDFHNCKRKAPSSNKKLLPRGADTGRYLVFLEKTMDEERGTFR